MATWNLAGRWSPAHHALLVDLDCDVLLLTEVSERVEVDGYLGHLGAASMMAKRRWAGVFARQPLETLPDPHPASAMARVGDWTFCSSILPWKGCGSGHPWVGDNHADRTEHALAALVSVLPRERLIWGGDWNHSLSGREVAGGKAGRAHVLAAIETLGLTVPTAELTHHLDDLLTIDHIAVPSSIPVLAAERVVAVANDRRLSDHDAYVVELGV